MKQVFVFILISLCYFACKQKEVVIPDNVIPYDTMVQVLSDVQQSEVAVLFLRNKGVSEIPKPEALYQHIFNTYKISDEEFDRSFKFYSAETEMMGKLYGDIIEELRKRQVDIESD